MVAMREQHTDLMGVYLRAISKFSATNRSTAGR
jgi:hypothetical protein